MLGASRFMEDCSLLKLKRKDLEEFSDDFSEFSLSSPARKIRRLDAELPPIVEEEECEMPLVSEYPSPAEEPNSGYNSKSAIKIEELSTDRLNEERAIVLFNPNSSVSTSFIPSFPSSYSVSLSPQILSGIKNHVLLPRKSNILIKADNEESEAGSSEPDNNRLAVIPWTVSPSQPPFITEPDNSSMMDLGEGEAMDVEDNVVQDQSSRMLIGDGYGFHQWQQQQQHCLVPYPPQNTSSPVGCYR